MADELIQPIDAEHEVALLALNNAHAEELSALDADRFRHLLGQAFWAMRIGAEDALLITFDQDADYESENFLWFRQRYPLFVYVDRIVVAPNARGRGLAARLYQALFERARALGHERVVCEVNEDPPNPASDAFHRRLGFAEVGSARRADGRKSVRYFEKPLQACR